MLSEIKTISLAIAFFAPFSWALTLLFDGVKKQKSRVYIFYLLMAASLVYFSTFMKFHNHLDVYMLLFPLQAALVIALFPLLFIYVKSLTNEKNLSVKQVLPHFIPAIFIFLFFVFYERVFLNSDDDLLFINYILELIYDNNISPIFKIGKSVYSIGKFIFVLQSLAYMVYIIINVKQYYLKIRDLFADSAKNQLNWLKTLGVFFAFMMIAHLIIHILNNNLVLKNAWLIIFSYGLFAAFFFVLGLNAFLQKELFDSNIISDTEGFSDEMKINKEDIEAYLLKEKPFLNPDISVYDVCYHFQTNRTYLSDAINKGFGLNFRGLINRYRVLESVELINRYKKLNLEISLENIADKSGFSSYSSFLRVFKSELGITPNEYAKNKIVDEK